MEELRKGLDIERTVRAERFFKSEVEAGRIQFRLRLDGRNWRMPFTIETTELETARQLLSRTGASLEKSLFSPVYENELNGDERDVAVYLDGEKALAWWHRNVARNADGIKGGRRRRYIPTSYSPCRERVRRSESLCLRQKAINSITSIPHINDKC